MDCVSSIHLSLLMSVLIFFLWTQEGAVNPHVLFRNFLGGNAQVCSYLPAYL